MAEKLPSRDSLRRLPHRTRTAFVARCARRIEPIFMATFGRSPVGHCDLYCAMIDAAERFAAGEFGVPEVFAMGQQVHETYTYVVTIAYGNFEKYGSGMRAFDVAYNARRSVYAPSGDASLFAREACDSAVDAAEKFAGEGARAWGGEVAKAMRFDFEMIKKAMRSQNWVDDTPVPCAFFGELWAVGVPIGWPPQ